MLVPPALKTGFQTNRFVTFRKSLIKCASDRSPVNTVFSDGSGTMKTGFRVLSSTERATLPRNACLSHPFPWVPSTITSHPLRVSDVKDLFHGIACPD